MKHLFIIFTIIISLVGCKTTKYIEKPVEIPVTKIEYMHLVDSIYLHDSIFQSLVTSNDTVYSTKNVYKTKIETKTDTILKTDTIREPVYITKYEKYNPSFIDKLKVFVDYFTDILIIGVLVFVVIGIYRYIKNK